MHARARIKQYTRVQGRSGDVLHPCVGSGQVYLTLNLELDVRVDLQSFFYFFILFLSENENRPAVQGRSVQTWVSSRPALTCRVNPFFYLFRKRN